MFLRVKEFQVELPHSKIDSITFGRGSKPLILIQGLNTRGIKGAGTSLAFLYRSFAKDYRVYLFDRRDSLYEGVSIRDFAADTAAVMDLLGLKQAAVVGVSQGGMIAQHLAVDRPDLVEKLVLAVTLARENDTLRSTVGRWITLTESRDFKELTKDMLEKLYTPAYTRRYRPLLPLLTLLQKPKDPERFLLLARACLGCNSYEQLHRIRCPVFVIGGRQDRVVGGEASIEIAEKLGCRLHLYDALGHAAYEEAKDFNRRVYDFLQE